MHLIGRSENNFRSKNIPCIKKHQEENASPNYSLHKLYSNTNITRVRSSESELTHQGLMLFYPLPCRN